MKSDEVTQGLFRVRPTDDRQDTWTVANGGDCMGSTEYIGRDGTVSETCTAFDTEADARKAFDLYLANVTRDSKPTNPKDALGGKRVFNTGATRDTDRDKLDFISALSPIVLERYVQYLGAHRLQPDGSYRTWDNWKKGLPIEESHKSLGRHYHDVWKLMHRYPALDNHGPVNIQDALCAIMFNAQAMLNEILEGRTGFLPETKPGYGGKP